MGNDIRHAEDFAEEALKSKMRKTQALWTIVWSELKLEFCSRWCLTLVEKIMSDVAVALFFNKFLRWQIVESLSKSSFF